MQVEFKNNNGERFLFVLLPKDAADVDVLGSEIYFKCFYFGSIVKKFRQLKPGNWKLLSLISEMTDVLWKDVTSTESGETLLKSLEIYLVNPLPHPMEDEPSSRDADEYGLAIEQWKFSESRSGNWYLLKEI